MPLSQEFYAMSKIANVLVVDDQLENLLLLEDLLSEEFDVHTASDGRQALNYLESGRPVDVVLLDIVMPRMNGFAVCEQIKANPDLKNLAVLFVTGLKNEEDEARGLSLGATDFINKPFSRPAVLARVRNQVKLVRAQEMLQLRNDNLELEVLERTKTIRQQSEELKAKNHHLLAAQDTIIMAFCSLAEARDNETGNHIRRTQSYVRALAEQLRDHPRFRDELDEETIEQLYKSAPLHDVGKVGIPDAILLKPGKLDADEWVIMKRHCEYGRDAIAQTEHGLGDKVISFLRYAREIAYSHHEKWDGTGYPQGLSGDSIPLSARLMAVADVYDALISERPYKKGFSHEKAVEIIREGIGNHFDPDVAEAMLQIHQSFRHIAQRFYDVLQPSV